MHTMGTAALRRTAAALSVAAAWGHAIAQPAGAPSAPHEALAFFEGTWTTSDATPDDDFRETCAWLAEARRHMVCRSAWQTPAGRREGLSIFSYDPVVDEYRYHGFRPGGAVVAHKGQRLPDGWLFTSDRGTGDDRRQTRVTLLRTAADRFRFLSETAEGSKPWQVGARFEYIRIAP